MIKLKSRKILLLRFQVWGNQSKLDRAKYELILIVILSILLGVYQESALLHWALGPLNQSEDAS